MVFPVNAFFAPTRVFSPSFPRLRVRGGAGKKDCFLRAICYNSGIIKHKRSEGLP